MMTNIELQFECESSSNSNGGMIRGEPVSSTGGTGTNQINHRNLINIRGESKQHAYSQSNSQRIGNNYDASKNRTATKTTRQTLTSHDLREQAYVAKINESQPSSLHYKASNQNILSSDPNEVREFNLKKQSRLSNPSRDLQNLDPQTQCCGSFLSFFKIQFKSKKSKEERKEDTEPHYQIVNSSIRESIVQANSVAFPDLVESPKASYIS